MSYIFRGSFILLTFLVFSSCENPLQEELDACNRNLYDEQRNSGQERDMLLHYIETFEKIQQLVDTLAYEKQQINAIVVNGDFRVTKQEEVANKVATMISILEEEETKLRQAMNNLSLKTDQIQGLERILDENKRVILQYQMDIGLLLKANEELAQVNDELDEELGTVGQELERLRQQAAEKPDNSKELINMISVLELEVNRLRVVMDEKVCILVLNRMMSKKVIEGNQIRLSCNLKARHILSRHPVNSFQIVSNYIAIVDPDEFWRYSNILLISMDKGVRCQIMN